MLTLKQNGPVAYQIKGNEVYNNVLATILPLYKNSTPEMGSKYFLSECGPVIFVYQIKRTKQTTKCMQDFWPYTHPDFWGLD